MKILLILGHPNKGSFNHAIAAACQARLTKNGHEVIFHDLYAEKFDPVIPAGEITKSRQIDPLIQQHCDELTECGGIVVVHPNWWGMPPAIVKGWIDRVIRAGVAYRFQEGDSGEGVPVGLLKAKAAVVFNTSDTGAEREDTVFGDPLETIWRNCIFDFCGVRQFERKIFRIVVTSSPEQRRQWLDEAAATVGRIFLKD
jgi:putative NADPH-quinone reductase